MVWPPGSYLPGAWGHYGPHGQHGQQRNAKNSLRGQQILALLSEFEAIDTALRTHIPKKHGPGLKLEEKKKKEELSERKGIQNTGKRGRTGQGMRTYQMQDREIGTAEAPTGSGADGPSHHVRRSTVGDLGTR